MQRSTAALREALEGDVVDAAKALLGAIVVRGERRARIVEVEAYRGLDDPGSHAFGGPTPRNLVMYGPPGHAYVYFTYGMHWMLNVVAQEQGVAAAVLVRAAEPLAGVEQMRTLRLKAPNDRGLLSGPAKLCAAFEITGRDNGLDLLEHRSELRIEPDAPVHRIVVGTRIGLSEGKGEHTPWRFADGDSLQWVSRPLTFGSC